MIRKMVTILFPVIMLAITLELVARAISTSYSIKHVKLTNKQDQIEILVLGSSQSNFGINPQYFGRESFNISNVSQDLYYDYMVLLKYLPKCRNIKMVIIPISYFTLQYDLCSSTEAWRSYYYSIYFGINSSAMASYFELGNYSALVLWDGPLGVIKNLHNGNKIKINEYGYQSPEGHRTKIRDFINDTSGKLRVKFHQKEMHSKLIDSNSLLLHKIASELKKRDIKIVFITTPTYKTYYDNISKATYASMINTINDVSCEYSGKYYNYFYDERFDISDFWDNDHLNEKGAKKFSIIIKNEIIDKFM